MSMSRDQTSAGRVTSPKSSLHSSSSSGSPGVKRKYVRKPREPSPEPQLVVYQINSRGREISLPRRYLL